MIMQNHEATKLDLNILYTNVSSHFYDLLDYWIWITCIFAKMMRCPNFSEIIVVEKTNAMNFFLIYKNGERWLDLYVRGLNSILILLKNVWT